MLIKTNINGLGIEYSIDERDIKYPRLELKTGSLLLVVPKGYNNPEKLIEEHKKWIYEKIVAINESKERFKGKTLNLERNDDKLRVYIFSLLDKFCLQLNVKHNRITLRNMKSKWGSCSSNNNMNFNKLLRYLPDELVEYVVYHEVVHLMEKKHDEKFWNIVSTKISNYKEKENDLMDYWFLIQELNVEGI